MAVVTATIKSEEQVMDSKFELLSIDVSKEFNKVPTAELRLIDGHVPTQKFEILDGGFFEPGKKIEIVLRYEGKPQEEKTIFKGIVVNQGLELSRLGTTLTIELSDEAIKMTSVRKNAVHHGKTDSKIISALIGQNGLTAGAILKEAITAKKLEGKQMVQYYATDWDFMMARAEANGHLVMVDDGEVSVIPPKIGSPPKSLQFELGQSQIYDFDIQVDARNQYDNVTARGWDVAKQDLTSSFKGKAYKVEQGTYDEPDMAKAVGGEEVTLRHPVPMDDAELKSWSGAQVMKSRLSLLRGWVKVPGDAKIKVGETIEIKGISEHFTGKNIVSGVRHEVSEEGWITYIQIGMDACWFTAQPNVVNTQAAGLLPGVNGLQIGIVRGYKEDEGNQILVRVSIPGLVSVEENSGDIFARFASLDAGGGVDKGNLQGMFFLPEVDEEVVVGFLNDDPRHPVILGGMYNTDNKIPAQFREKGKSSGAVTPLRKGIVTKSGSQLLFDEEENKITLATSDKNLITIDEGKEVISMEDTHGNRVVMDKDGVTIESAKDLQIDTKGDFKVKANGNVEIEGKKVDLI